MDGRTDRQTMTTMPIARPLFKYSRLKTWPPGVILYPFGFSRGHVHLCQMAGSFLIPYSRWCSIALWWLFHKELCIALNFKLSNFHTSQYPCCCWCCWWWWCVCCKGNAQCVQRLSSFSWRTHAVFTTSHWTAQYPVPPGWVWLRALSSHLVCLPAKV